MSVRIMSLVWDTPHINTNEQLLLLAIADHCNDEGICYPSAERLRKKCRWGSKATYNKNISTLSKAGLINKKPRASTKDGRITDLIILNIELLKKGVDPKEIAKIRLENRQKSFKSTHGCTLEENQGLTDDRKSKSTHGCTLEENQGLSMGKSTHGCTQTIIGTSPSVFEWTLTKAEISKIATAKESE